MKQMRKLHRNVPVAIALILGLTSTSCLYTKRVILRHGKPVTAATAPKLQNSTLQGLNSRIANLYNAMNSFQATVDMTPSLGSVYKGEITEIKDIRGFILFRKPADIRIIGQLPWCAPRFRYGVERQYFKLSLVTKSLFVSVPTPRRLSHRTVREPSPRGVSVFHDDLPSRPRRESVFLEDDTDEENALLSFTIIKRGPDGQLLPDRRHLVRPHRPQHRSPDDL